LANIYRRWLCFGHQSVSLSDSQLAQIIDAMAIIEPTRSPSKDAKNVYGDSSVVPVDGLAVEGDTAELRSRFTYEDAERLKRKADVRLLVLLSLCYLCKNIDNNVISVRATRFISPTKLMAASSSPP
jgi:hypothetical protein